MVGHGGNIAALSVTGGYGLRIEIVGIDEVRVFRAEVQTGIQDLALRGDVVELREGVHALVLRHAGRILERLVGNFIEKILQSRDDKQAIADDGSAYNGARLLIANPLYVVAAHHHIGKWIVQIGMPFIAAAFGLHRDDGLCEAPVLREEGK